MKFNFKVILALFSSLIFISLLPLPILAQTKNSSISSASLAQFKLPQPQEVIINNMQPSQNAAPTSPKAQPTNSFGQLIKKTITSFTADANSTGSNQSQPSTRSTKQTTVTIALIGDSMIDTMGTSTPYLYEALRKIYPQTQFTLLNYGIGSTNINSGISRLTSPFNYQDRNYNSPLSTNPEIIIIESFAYNPLPLTNENLTLHASQLTEMINLVKSQTQATPMFLTTIAPHLQQFGLGPDGVNWDQDTIIKHTQAIKAYLENTIAVAKNTQTFLIDAFHPSQDKLGSGKLYLIDPGGHIHPSVAGHIFIGQKIASAIAASRVLE